MKLEVGSRKVRILSFFFFFFLDFQLQNDMCIAKTEISWTRVFIVWFK